MFPELPARPDSWYLMDPAGWVMMRYDQRLLQGRDRRPQVPAEELQWLSLHPVAAPSAPARATWRDYKELTKPGVVA
jgi:hypothetical protein